MARAEYNDGRTAQTHAVVLAFTGGALEARDRDGIRVAVWPVEGVVAGNPSKTPLRLRQNIDNGERIVVRDAVSAAQVREWLGPVLSDQKTRKRNRWLLGTAVVWLGLLGLWLASSTILAVVTDLVPYAWERRMGEEIRDTVARILSDTYRGEIPWRNSGPGYEALEALTERLAGAVEKSGYTFQVSVLDASLVNAFALPGGYIVVTTGLIRQCRSPDELAGVLAHEMAHVTERHNTRHLVREQLYAFLGKVLTGGSDVMRVVHSAGSAMVSSKFSRDDEREADILGTRRLAGAGIDPNAIGLFFAGLPKRAKQDRFSYLDSHPALGDRQDYMKAEASRFEGPFTPALSPEQWRALRDLAGKKDGAAD